jgi:hypothetical protein
MNTDIFSILVGTYIDDPSHIIKQGWHNVRPFMTGCLIIVDVIYSICEGTVVDIGIDDKNNLYSITVEYDYDIWIRYCLLKSCSVSVGDSVAIGTELGITDDGLLRFEYCNDDFSVFPLRINDRQLYKHDPMPILIGEVELPNAEVEVEIEDPTDDGNESE